MHCCGMQLDCKSPEHVVCGSYWAVTDSVPRLAALQLHINWLLQLLHILLLGP